MNESISSTEINDPMIPVPIPAQVPVKEGVAELPDTHLGYWDTGGGGEPVVFLHPASGSALVWLYQQRFTPKARPASPGPTLRLMTLNILCRPRSVVATLRIHP